MDIKFISGEANVIDWVPNENDLSDNMGGGKYGACCAEMDIWEANSMSTAYTPHTCGIEGQLKCEGIECGDNSKGERYDGVCDKDGCDINPYRLGNLDFYGRGSQYAVNTLKTMTVVTQFLTTDGTDSGDLSEIRRFYVQDGKVIHSPSSTILGADDSDSITDAFCDAKKDLFGDIKDYQEHGGMKGMGESLDRPETDPGIKRGECPGGIESTPEYLRENFPDGYVTFKNAAVGEIGSTYILPPTQAPNPAPTPTTTPPTEGCYSNNYKDCLPNGYTSSDTSCNKIWLPNGAQDNCVALWGDCTGNASGCCGPAYCFSDNTHASCFPPTTVPSTPTAAPTIFQTPAPSKSCLVMGEKCKKNSDCCEKKCRKKKCRKP